MNNTFNFRRFGLYARKEFRENWKAYALGLVGIVAFLGYNVFHEWAFVHSRFYMSDTYQVEIYPYLAIIMGMTVWIASSYPLKSFSNRKHTLATLILPVSSFERFLYAWIVALPLSVLVCYVIWKILWSIAWPLFLRDAPKLGITFSSIYWTENPYFSVFFLGGSAIFMWGAVTLGRLNFLKTLGIVIAAGLLLFKWGQEKFLKILFSTAYHIQTPAPAPWVPQSINIESSKGVYSGSIHSAFEGVYQFWWVLCVPLLLYVITFLKIKEKEA